MPITVRCMRNVPPPTTAQSIDAMMLEVKNGMKALRQQLLTRYDGEGEGNRVVDGFLVVW